MAHGRARTPRAAGRGTASRTSFVCPRARDARLDIGQLARPRRVERTADGVQAEDVGERKVSALDGAHGRLHGDGRAVEHRLDAFHVRGAPRPLDCGEVEQILGRRVDNVRAARQRARALMHSASGQAQPLLDELLLRWRGRQ
eukprot:3289516-Prymnesium_polylepis.1